MNGENIHDLCTNFVNNTRHCNENCLQSNENNEQETILKI
jgi:hypothetical protein